jgi:prepilin-type N-terminal cleavage/methylation domain-containing protein/prepilin-type processing-associated H-X9-DG protein
MTRLPSNIPARRARFRSAGFTAAFTLVELLVVIGIIALLMAILLPSVAGTRRQSRALQCASNVRQLCTAIFGYAADNKGRFPTNLQSPAPGDYWYYPASAGGYACKTGPAIGTVFTCPDDLETSRRSYAMNIWASSTLDPVIAGLVPKRGQLWGPTPRDSSRLILITESWDVYSPDGFGREFETWPVIGYRGTTAGQRFGAGSGLAPPIDAGPFGKANSELAFARHRPFGSSGTGTLPIGGINIGYADGHVSLKRHGELADPETGKSTLDSLWSAWDLNNP